MTVFVTSQRASYSATLTEPQYRDTLGPITLRVSTGVATVQDYLTPTQARVLADQLVAAAQVVEARS